MPLADLCWKRMADMPTGAHIDISTYGDLATLHWVENEPLAPGVLECEVAYGALSYPWLGDRPVLQPAMLCLIAYSERQVEHSCASWKHMQVMALPVSHSGWSACCGQLLL